MNNIKYFSLSLIIFIIIYYVFLTINIHAQYIKDATLDTNMPISNAYLENLIENDNPGLVIKLIDQLSLNQQSRYLSYKTIAFDNIGDKQEAINNGLVYLTKNANITTPASEKLKILEIYWRNNYKSVKNNLFIPDLSELRLYNNFNELLTSSLKHYLFLYFIRNKYYSSALSIYNINRYNRLFNQVKELDSQFYYRLWEKLATIDHPSVYIELLNLSKPLRSNVDVITSYIELLIDLQDYSQAKVVYNDSKRLLNENEEHKRILSNKIEVGKQSLPITIGVILPIKEDRFKYIGDQIIGGLLHGFEELNLDEKNIIFEFADPGKNLDDIVNAYKVLVVNKSAEIILGPVTKLTTEILFEVVENYNVPYLSYSVSANKENIPTGSMFIQRNKQAEAKQIALYARENLCKLNAIVLYNSQSEKEKNSFIDYFHIFGGNIIASYNVKNYKRSMTDIYNDFTGKEVYNTGSSLYADATDDEGEIIDATPSTFDMIFSTLPDDSVKLLYDFNKVFELYDIPLLGLSNFKSISNQNMLNSEIKSYFSDSLPQTEFNKSIQHDIWKNNIVNSEFNEINSYSLFGYITSILLDKVFESNISSWALKRLILLDELEINGIGKITNKKSEIFINPKVFTIENEELVVAPNNVDCQYQLEYDDSIE